MSGPYREDPARREEHRVLTRSTLPPAPTREFRALDFSDGSLVIQWLQPARILGTRAPVLGLAVGLAAVIPGAMLLPHVAAGVFLFGAGLAGAGYAVLRPDVAVELEVNPSALAWRENKPGGRHGALLVSEVVDVRLVHDHSYAVQVQSTTTFINLFRRIASDDEPLREADATWIVERVREALGRARG